MISDRALFITTLACSRVNSIISIDAVAEEGGWVALAVIGASPTLGSSRGTAGPAGFRMAWWAL
jgi:hypothetical protein